MLFSPAIFLLVSALILAFCPVRLRQMLMLLLPLLALGLVWLIPMDAREETAFAGFTLQILAVHDFTRIFATGFCLILFAGSLYGLKHHTRMEITAAFFYAGSAIGVTFAGDLITLFIYWEAMMLASTLLVAAGGNKRARRAAHRYLYMHLLGGTFLLLGITAYIPLAGGDALISSITLPEHFLLDIWQNGFAADGKTISLALILLGVLVNAAVFPFSAWLPDSYPEASAVGSVFLSAFTTKTAVFVLLTIFSGVSILIPLGLIMAFYGIFYAMLENDIRRMLAFSIINQGGFMLAGIGIGSTLAQYGVATHAFFCLIYMALLFMSAGSVITMTGKRRCSDLGGLYHTMRVTAVCGVIGALSIAAFPLTGGFISKPLIAGAAAEAKMAGVWFLLLAASAGVLLHAGLKYPWFVFFQKDSGMRPKDPPLPMQAGMLLLAVICIIPALYPPLIYGMLPTEVTYETYTLEHVVTHIQLLLFGGLSFFVTLQFTQLLKRTETITLDIDWLYRKFLHHALLLIERFAYTLAYQWVRFMRFMQKYIIALLYHYHRPEGVFARNWSVSVTVLYSAALLGIFTALYLLQK